MSTVEVALAGNPNCGKTALFNALTGSRQKVANYAGVTVEKKVGEIGAPSGRRLRVADLPGTYSLHPRSLDEQIARDVILGIQKNEVAPDVLIAVVDASQLERNLSLVLEMRALGKPLIVALNMMDLARARGLDLDLARLSQELGVPVVPTVAIHEEGTRELTMEIDRLASQGFSSVAAACPDWTPTQRFAEVDRILRASIRGRIQPDLWTDRLDRWALHPVWGSLFLILVLFAMFQVVFSGAAPLQDAMEAGLGMLAEGLRRVIPSGAIQSLLVDGALAGVGSVLVFLPQILLLFLFILILEDSGYMARAAFLMDRLMSRVGLHGRAFIPLLSSFACAIPGILATRTIDQRKDRIATILVTPLIPCSARLPVYSLLIAAFIPNSSVWGPIRLQGLVMLALFGVGVGSALAVAWVLKRWVLRAQTPPLMLELPSYKMPYYRNILLGLWERAMMFVRRAGGVILALSVLIWFLASYPKPDPSQVSAEYPAIRSSFAGKIGTWIEPALRPVGFDWRIATGLIPGFAAREVMVSALATVYAVEAQGQDEAVVTDELRGRLRQTWPLATALALLAWYVFAPQCVSTIAVVRRETGGWKWAIFLVLYLTAMAYLAAWAVFRIAGG